MSTKFHFKTLVPGSKGNAGTLEVTAPFDGSVIGSVEIADAATVEHIQRDIFKGTDKM